MQILFPMYGSTGITPPRFYGERILVELFNEAGCDDEYGIRYKENRVKFEEYIKDHYQMTLLRSPGEAIYGIEAPDEICTYLEMRFNV